MTTNELLRCYVSERSETAFAELVRQHIDLVYSAALRQVNGDAPAAQDVTQTVFSDLACKAPRLTRHTSLTGWLYTSTRYLASKARRADQRRRAREQEAHAMNQLLNASTPDPVWQELRPLLDDAMHELNASDREVVLMRYFEHRPLAEVGTRLGLTENAARMRVDRALDKLRHALARRGVTSTLVALGTALTERAVSAVPAQLTSQISQTAFAAGAAGAGVMATVLNFLAPLNAQILLGTAAVALLSALLVLPQALHTNRGNAINAPAPVAQPPTNAPVASTADPTPDRTNALPAATLATTNKLVLHLVAADNGKPVPMVALDYWLWISGKVSHKQPLRANRFGVCEVPVPRDTVTELILVSQCDGFADTRLEWQTDRGMTIPAEYTLRLGRSVPIGGLVVDADGKPISGAEVGFNNEVGQTDPSHETLPESSNFGWPFWITATADASGRWQIDRLSPEALRTIYGGASHPEHVASDHIFLARTPDTVKPLLAGTYVFHLGRAVAARGIVVDPDGHPIPGAKVLVGGVSMSGRRETIAQADGTFYVAGCKPGPNSLSAEAKGFAPTTIDATVGEDTPSVTLTLHPGKLLRLRVVNQRGSPVSKATVWLNTFDHGSMDGAAHKISLVQTEFNRETGPDGRLEWDSAPDQELTFDFSASGYMRVGNVKITPDSLEHSITLPTALTISGTVRDANTGKPIPAFRIITGWPERDPFSASTNAHWSTLDRFWISFEGGRFDHVFEEQVLVTTPNPGFVFKFVADGYASLITRPLAGDETNAQFDVLLRPAATTTVSVILPNGSPAANADVGLVAPGARLQLRPGGFAHESQSGGSLLTAGSQGRFVLPPDESMQRIIAAHPDGYAEATPAALAAEPTLPLQPWGRLEGTFLSGGHPAAGRQLLFQYGSGDFETVSSDFQAYQVKTDDYGRFAFAQVPQGKHRLVQLIQTAGSPGGTVWTHEPLMDVEIRPGETTTANPGASGYAVTARLRWPAGLQREANWRLFATIHTPAPRPPTETANDPQALAAWYATPEMRAAMRAVRNYRFTETTDGLATADNVPPGSYLASVAVCEVPISGGEAKLRARVEIPLVVPSDPPSGALDLGELLLQPAQ